MKTNKAPSQTKAKAKVAKPIKAAQPPKVTEVTKESSSITERVRSFAEDVWRFFKRHWIGTLVILLATIIFFWPVIIRIDSYSPGGDAMFNAWTLSRDQHCILRQHCSVYANSNIFYPHTDTMLYSETQLSAAVVTMPVHFFEQNPLLQENLLTIVLFFMSGWCMYLLAKYLSRGHELVSISAGLIFEFAPFRMAAIWHLQNLSIFCLPLAVYLILKFFDSGQKKFLWCLFPALLYVFFGSWVQMVFVLIAIGMLLLGYGIAKTAAWRSIAKVAIVTAIAALATAPLAIQYVQFSKSNNASFSVASQELYASSVADYFIPNNGTLLGKLYYKVRTHAEVNAYNLDSYSYHGIVLYVIALILIVCVLFYSRKLKIDKRTRTLILTMAALAVVGVLISFGPFLKLKGSYTYPGLADGIPVVIPTPYAIVDKLLPQLHFIRAVGRASVLPLFVLCSFLALFPAFLKGISFVNRRHYLLIMGVVYVLIVVELLPAHRVPMSSVPQTYNLSIPAVYKYVNAHPKIDDIAILQSNDDYPGATDVAWLENVLWSGYYNRNIFNGYSGYIPPDYMPEYVDFVQFNPQTTPAEMKSVGVKYVIINKDLSGPNSRRPYLLPNVEKTFPVIYQDKHYALFKVVQ